LNIRFQTWNHGPKADGHSIVGSLTSAREDAALHNAFLVKLDERCAHQHFWRMACTNLQRPSIRSVLSRCCSRKHHSIVQCVRQRWSQQVSVGRNGRHAEHAAQGEQRRGVCWIQVRRCKCQRTQNHLRHAGGRLTHESAGSRLAHTCHLSRTSQNTETPGSLAAAQEHRGTTGAMRSPQSTQAPLKICLYVYIFCLLTVAALTASGGGRRLVSDGSRNPR